MSVSFDRGVRTIKSAWLEILAAGGLLYFSVKLFLMFGFIYFIWRLYSELDYIRAGIRIYQVANEARMLAIIRKLGIEESELEAMGNEINAKMSSEARKNIKDDYTLSMS